MIRILIAAFVLACLESYGQTRDYKAKAYYLEGMDKVAKKDYHGAITKFTDAIHRDTGFIQAYENRGVAKYYLNDNTGAISDYNIALEINPNDYNTHGRRGWAEFFNREYKAAIADFTKALEGNSNNIHYYNIRGQAEYMIQDYLGAISDFTRVIKTWPGETEQKNKAYYWRGLSKIDLGYKDNGCSDLRKAAEMKYPEAYDAVQKYCQ